MVWYLFVTLSLVTPMSDWPVTYRVHTQENQSLSCTYTITYSCGDKTLLILSLNFNTFVIACWVTRSLGSGLDKPLLAKSLRWLSFYIIQSCFRPASTLDKSSVTLFYFRFSNSPISTAHWECSRERSMDKKVRHVLYNLWTEFIKVCLF